MMNVLGYAAVVTLAAALTATVVDAQTAPRAGRAPGWRARQMPQGRAARAWHRQLRGIGLDENQRTEIRQLAQKHRQELQTLNRSVQAARRSLNQAFTADKVDEGAIRNQATALAAAQADLAVARARLRSEILGVLTPVQQQQLRDRQQKMRQQLRQRRQREMG
jgi:Spy/CpxP family protein refolding chaperone